MKIFHSTAVGLVLAASVLLAGCSDGFNSKINIDNDGTTTTTTTTTTTEAAQDQPSEASSDGITRSYVDGNGQYIVEFLGIGADVSDAYYIYSDEELAEYNGMDELTDKTLADAMDSEDGIGIVVYDSLICLGEDGDVIFALVYENLASSGQEDYTLEEYINSALEENENYYDSMKTVTVSFAGQSRTAVLAGFEDDGDTVWQLIVFIKKGSVMGGFTFTCAGSNDFDDALGRFYSLTGGTASDNEGANTTSEDTAGAQQPAAASSFTHSTIASNGTYTCEFLGIGADLDEAYYIYDDEDLADINGISEISDEALEKALNSNGTIYDAMVYINEDGDNFNLTYEDLSWSGSSGMSLSDYIDTAFESLEYQLELMGMSASNLEKVTAYFAGQDRTAIYLENEYGGETFYQLLIALQNGDYIGCLTFTAYDMEYVEQMMSWFYAL